MIYDCFPFFNELDLLEIRLNILKDVVDKFVLVEAPWTHRGNPKPLYFDENKSRFAPFLDRIIHVVVKEDDVIRSAIESGDPGWVLENIQRNRISEGLKDAKPEDVILISDLDEIPNPDKIPAVLPFGEVWCFELYHTFYRFNLVNCTRPKWLGTRALTYKTFVSPEGYRLETRHPIIDLAINGIPSATRIRSVWNGRRIKRAGWHFSYLGDAAHIAIKKRSIVEGSDVTGDRVSSAFLEKCISTGRDVNLSMDRYLPWPPNDRRLPRHVTENLDRYERYMADPKAFHCIALRRILYRLYGIAYVSVKRLIPGALLQKLYEMKIRRAHKQVTA